MLEVKILSVKNVNEQILGLAIQVLTEQPEGLRFSNLLNKISQKDPSLNLKTLNTIIAARRKNIKISFIFFCIVKKTNIEKK